MSTSSSAFDRAVEHCQPEDVTPVRLRAETIESTAPERLLDLKRELQGEGLTPARLVVSVSFDEDCSFAVQEEAERIREYVRAAAFLGAGAVTVETKSVAEEGKVRPALAACAERAEREGVTLTVEGPVSVESER